LEHRSFYSIILGILPTSEVWNKEVTKFTSTLRLAILNC